ncbi:type VI secretion system-associated FHA domain protein TagH [Azorhizobium doebereinerae]|uniref:type VI secretion system-associated FHA domain protein TagH n=1 Tax=Azorhizobium doebereinerae TaxID=281091 RepID=UPI0003FE6382|nr:type VI secretion system-associated FHA domain protein TagH [Azorhizobium doebereinerae]
MRARLTVTSEQQQSLGADAFRDFEQAGGVIGRATTCDWRLPDSTHTVSARHAEIRHTGHGFVVVDLSTNGVYVNTTDAPLGRGNSAALVSGDTLYLGTYVISVEILKTDARPRPESWAAAPASAPPAAAPFADPLWPAAPARTAASAYRAPAPQRPLDPLAALDGADTAPEGDNPFFELGLVRKSGETTSGWRDLLDSRSRPAAAAPQPPQPPFAPAAPPMAPPAFGAAPAPAGIIPADFALGPLGPPPVPPAPPQPLLAQAPEPPVFAPPAPAFAPAVPALAFTSPVSASPAPPAGAIPAGFLDDLAGLMPRPAPQPALPGADLPPLPAAPPGAEAPLSISRGVSTRAPAEGTGAPDPVSLLRQRAAARGGAAPGPVPPHAAPAREDATALPAAALPAARMAAPAPAPQAQPTPAPQALPIPAPLPPLPAGVLPPGGDPAEPLFALLGLDGASLPPHARAALFADVAGLLLEMADGLVAVLEARRLIKDGFHLDQTRLKPVENNPFKFCASGREALDKALVQRAPGFLAPAQAARAGFDDVKVHEIAAMEAMQATIARLLQRVSPAAVTFEVEGEAAANPGLFGRKLDKGRLWDRYLAMHERLVDALDVISPEVVGEEFARAYAHHSQDLRHQDPHQHNPRRRDP